MHKSQITRSTVHNARTVSVVATAAGKASGTPATHLSPTHRHGNKYHHEGCRCGDEVGYRPNSDPWPLFSGVSRTEARHPLLLCRPRPDTGTSLSISSCIYPVAAPSPISGPQTQQGPTSFAKYTRYWGWWDGMGRPDPNTSNCCNLFICNVCNLPSLERSSQ